MYFYNMNKITILLIFLACSLATDAKKKQKLPECNGRVVTIETTEGTMKVRLYDSVKEHADNFFKLAGSGYYDSTLFHRVINNFMIQGGDPQSKTAANGVALGNGDIGYTIPADFKPAQYMHKKGALCAARTSNPAKASSGCQYYIVQGKAITDAELIQMEERKKIKYSDAQKEIYKTWGGTPFLDNEYTVYGEIMEGLEILDKIAQVKTATGDRPVVDVRVIKMTVCPAPVVEKTAKKKKKNK
jgi:cyclophilin family peptidyl-prolyl cis-trans isomerase